MPSGQSEGTDQRDALERDAEAALPGLHFCANWRGGVSVADCIKSGHAAAEAVQKFLHERPAGAA